MKYFLLKLTILFAVMLPVACQHSRHIDAMLASADKIVCAHPDSALRLLHAIDTVGISDNQRAYYYLLETKASDKAYLDPQDVAPIDYATRVFRGRNDSVEAQALYYKGVVQYNNSDYGRALVSLMQAHEIADNCGDLFYKAMSSRSMGDVYGMVVAFDAAAKSDSIAIEEFIAANRPIHAKYEYQILPHYLIRSGRIDEANKILDRNAEDPFFFETPERQRWYYVNRAFACYENEDYEEAIEWYDKCINSHPDQMVANDWGRYANCKLKLGDIIAASKALDSIKAKANEWTGDNYVSTVAAKLEVANNNYESAYKIIYEYYALRNKEHNWLMSHPYTTVLTDYLSEVSTERLSELKSAEIQRLMLIVIIVLCLVVCCSIYIIWIRQSKLKQIETENLLNDIAKLKAKFRDESAECNLENSGSGAGIGPSFIKFIDQLCVMESQSPKSEEGDRFLRKTFNITLERLKDQAILHELERFVNLSKNNIIERLNAQVLNVTKKQSDCFMLKLAGFSNASICSILSINTINALHQMKSRLKNNIINSDAIDKAWFLSELEVKNSKS